jgi:hypothetical protein
LTLSSITLRAHRSPSPPLLAHGLPVKRFFDLFRVRALRALRFHHHHCSHMIIHETFSNYFECEHLVLPFMPSSPLLAHGLPVKRFLDLFQVRALRALRFHHHNCSYMISMKRFRLISSTSTPCSRLSHHHHCSHMVADVEFYHVLRERSLSPLSERKRRDFLTRPGFDPGLLGLFNLGCPVSSRLSTPIVGWCDLSPPW